jgi:hypothetical protein
MNERGKFISFEGIDGALSSVRPLCKPAAIIPLYVKRKPAISRFAVPTWDRK